ncbi:unnamed protein product, partial [Owenia fusiformis]
MDGKDIRGQTRSGLHDNTVPIHKTTEQDQNEKDYTPTKTSEWVTLISNWKVPCVTLDRIEALDKIAKYNAKCGNLFAIHLSNIKFDTFTKGRPSNEPCNKVFTETYIIDETYEPSIDNNSLLEPKAESSASYIKHVKSEPHLAEIISNTRSESHDIRCQSRATNITPNKENISESFDMNNDLYANLTDDKTNANNKKTDTNTSITSNIPDSLSYIPICIKEEEDKSDINLKDGSEIIIDKPDSQTSDATDISDLMSYSPMFISEEEDNCNINLKDGN